MTSLPALASGFSSILSLGHEKEASEGRFFSMGQCWLYDLFNLAVDQLSRL